MTQAVNKKKILLVEDEPNLAFNLLFNLQQEGYLVTASTDGLHALEVYNSEGPFDLILLDVMLPGINGFEVAKNIRQNDQITGILMLTAKSSEEDRIQGFTVGVDDYLIKPFSLAELLLRIRRMLTRKDFFDIGLNSANSLNTLDALNKGPVPAESFFRAGQIKLNISSLELETQNGKFNITDLEAKILKEFLSHPNKVLPREYLLSYVWGIKAHLETRTVDNFIVRLRRYLEKDPSNPEQLVSIRGKGYRLNI
ncbi:MAG: response regulator transcription factor [Oligoflexales bacterium]|nr:response regulator transcription factor [Oligoflexales bacterium]